MRVLDLPRRRYSVPETIMRKYRLRQRAESNTSSSSEECRRRRCADKSIQTSPRESIGRTSSLPFLATPSPCVWSYTTSDCQTVSDRTTSTQDSTLSVPSTTPESYTNLFRTEEAGTQVSFPDRTDRTTSVTGLLADRTEETVLDIAVSIETDMSDETVVEANRRRGEPVIKKEEMVNTACQTGNHGLFKVPEINVFKDSSESQSDEKPMQMKEQCSQVTVAEISQEMTPIEFHDRLRTDMACTGSNYDKFPIENPVIPRYSAIPRTNSMIVNTSSIDYSSDSELSLTDSLEDPDEFRTSRLRKQSKHDQRMVRGEVTMEQERKRLPKSKDAYAYFLSLTGEEEIIREYTIPEWLRNRLRKREQEIKKEYEDKLIRHQQYTLHRRRKKTVRRVRRVNLHSSDEKSNRNDTNVAVPYTKHEKMAIFQECHNNNNNINKNNLNPGPSTKNPSIRLVNGNNMGFEPKIDNIQRNKFNNNHSNNNNNHNNGNDNNGRDQNQRFKQTEVSKSSNTNPNLVQISEIIKIEMSDNLKTIITKEKQINLAPEINLKKTTSETIKEELSNTTKSIMTKNCENFYKNDMNIIQSTSEIETKGNTESSTNKLDLEKQGEKSMKTEKDYLRVPDVKKENANSVTAENKVTETTKATGGTIQNGISNTKIELERSIADILITALEENTRARQMSMRTTETLTLSEEQMDGHLKRFVDQGSQKNEYENEVQPPNTRSHAVQTDGHLYNKEKSTNTVTRSDISCNTEPYLVSVCLQTSDSHDQEESDNSESDTNEVEMAIGSFDEEESSEDFPIADDSLRMVDKACNTVESTSISTQTNISILQSDDIVNRIKKEKGDKKKDVQFPSQVIKQIITGTGEYMTVDMQSSAKNKERNQKKNRKGKISKGTNTEELESVTENNKNINNYNPDPILNRTPQTPYCKNTFSTKSHKKKSQVLELNVPVCTCHMCTLQRISPRGDLSKSKIPQGKKSIDSREEQKKVPKFITRRSNVTGQIPKFRMFEAIPEEKNSSTDSTPEDGIGQEKSKPSTTEKQEKGVLTEPHLVDQIIQVSSNNVNAATNTEPNVICSNRTAEATQTSEQPKRKSNLVIGRFRSENRESPMLVRQYKGRASLSAGHVEGQEELLTLSKGWINFYLLRDNLEFSDSNGEEASMCQTQVTETRRRIQTVEKEEDKIEEYTVEIHATPESESKNIGRGRVILPEINTSSSSSTPEKDRKKASTPAVETLPGVKKSKRTKRSQIKLTREAITELGTRNRSEQEKMSSRAVEVACSEQSISSITSSTVILSESPPPQQLKLPERRSHHRHRIHRNIGNHANNGSNWTVTVAGSSGSGNDPPPDVEMKLTFGKQAKKQENGTHQYHQFIRTKRQDPMIEEFAHMSRNEKHNQLEYTLQPNHHPKSCFERTRGGTARDNFSYEEEYINRLSSRRSKYSTEDGSETTGDLHVTGLAITPEKKPRVPTQSERDILRPQRYKFTR